MASTAYPAVVAFMLATAVVQAKQCSSCEECPINDEPKNVVSLLQGKLQMNPTIPIAGVETPSTPAPDPPQCSGDWTLGAKGVVDGCPPGYRGIFDQTMCQQAAISLGLGSADRLHPNSISSLYPGCYSNDGQVAFNTHPNPKGTEHQEHAGQVCMCEALPTPAPDAQCSGSGKWTLGAKGVVDGCPAGYSGIFDQTICQEAATSLELGSADRLHPNSISSLYPGCYVNEGHVGFNKHPNPTGTEQQEHAGQVCMCEACSGDWTLGANGSVDGCPTGYSGISDQTICQEAAICLELASDERLWPNSISSLYPGCYFNDGHVAFNTHPNPKGTEHQEHAGQVCMGEAPPAPDPPQCSGDWTLGAKGVVDGCPPGYSGIFDEAICQQAATSLELGSAGRLVPNSVGSLYPGCYFNDGHVAFNTHPNPKGTEHQEHAGQVCMCEVS